MIWILAGGVIGGIIGFFYLYREPAGFVQGLIIGAFIGLLSAMVVGATGESGYALNSKTQLTAFSDCELEGSYYLLERGEGAYAYPTQTIPYGNGGYVARWKNLHAAASVTEGDGEEESVTVEIRREERQNGIIETWQQESWELRFSGIYSGDNVRKVVRVPKGSILKDASCFG